jgi:aminomethyltransferase
MVPFGGWDMPVQYSGILSEVKAVRTGTGIFDVSHMGRVYLSGPQAGELLDWVLTGSATTLRIGRARYCMICNEAGGVIDDTIFYRLDEQRYLLVPNAGNRDEVVAWLQKWLAERFAGGCDIEDRTLETGLLAVQGPEAAKLVDRLCTLADGTSPSGLRMFTWGPGAWTAGELQEKSVFLGRTGYTGEDGFELVVDAADAAAAWDLLVSHGATPCGLGARDVLRLEAGLPLHGHEIDRDTSPIEAGLERFVRQDGEFLGSEVLRKQRQDGVERKLVGLRLPGRSAPRAEYPILYQGEPIGRVTSGSYSPTLDSSIAMGYVLVRYADPGQRLDVDIRGRTTPVEVVPLPFYTRPRSSQ